MSDRITYAVMMIIIQSPEAMQFQGYLWKSQNNIYINSCLATSYEAEFIEMELCVRFFFVGAQTLAVNFVALIRYLWFLRKILRC